MDREAKIDAGGLHSLWLREFLTIVSAGGE